MREESFLTHNTDLDGGLVYHVLNLNREVIVA